ncbi:TetR/AcrR family transcriptional regulator [Spirillospora sp. CA-294931]|uniref:TetR/AcrR family transcriptional regulator n=1 Tax=Spirillospora sp. CA-294931 TaxID=3240042 RepID=UPI003D8ADF7F
MRSPPPPPGNRIIPSLIITAAVRLLDERGGERDITLRSVARAIGIAAPSIYPHVPDQPAIMLAVVQQEFDRLAQHLRAAAKSDQDPPGPGRIMRCDVGA